MTYFYNRVFGEIIETTNEKENLISKIYLWKDVGKYEESFVIYEDEEQPVIYLDWYGKIQINRRYLLEEKIIEKNNIKYLKISFEKTFKQIEWIKLIPKSIVDNHGDLLDIHNCYDFYKKTVLNFFNKETKNRSFVFRFSRNEKMLNIIIKNNKIYLLIKLNEINQDRDKNYIYY